MHSDLLVLRLFKMVPPSGGSLEIGNILGVLLDPFNETRSPFGGIPRNWKQVEIGSDVQHFSLLVPPSGGSLEIGNMIVLPNGSRDLPVPPSGGSLEIGNSGRLALMMMAFGVPPSGGSLEIGNVE
jgi:hypothetical protein